MMFRILNLNFNSPCLDEERPNATNASIPSTLRNISSGEEHIIYGGMYVPNEYMTREETNNNTQLECPEEEEGQSYTMLHH